MESRVLILSSMIPSTNYLSQNAGLGPEGSSSDAVRERTEEKGGGRPGWHHPEEKPPSRNPLYALGDAPARSRGDRMIRG